MNVIKLSTCDCSLEYKQVCIFVTPKTAREPRRASDMWLWAQHAEPIASSSIL